MTDYTTERDSPLLSWADDALSKKLPGAQIIARELLSSRTGRLWRIRVGTPTGERSFYAKAFGKRDGEMPDLTALATSFRNGTEARFVDVLATETALDAVLIGEAEGESLSDFRRRALLGLDFRRLTRVWKGVGQWLRTLHWETMTPRVDVGGIPQRAAYIKVRLRHWAALDSAGSALAESAVAAVDAMASDLDSVTLTPCHGDVSAGNIFVGNDVTFVDFDDCRFDLPALDLSQAIMEIAEYGRVGSLIQLPGIAQSCERSFRAGYGDDRWPSGPAWFLPHLRNLAVYLVTLAPKRFAPSEGARYRRTWRELRRTLADCSLAKKRGD